MFRCMLSHAQSIMDPKLPNECNMYIEPRRNPFPLIPLHSPSRYLDQFTTKLLRPPDTLSYQTKMRSLTEYVHQSPQEVKYVRSNDRIHLLVVLDRVELLLEGAVVSMGVAVQVGGPLLLP